MTVTDTATGWSPADDACVLTGGVIMITGGTGSLGRAFIEYALTNLDPRRIIIYSRDELKQFELREHFGRAPRLQWIIGDIRDLDRLRSAMRGVEYVVHAAALKQVDTAELNAIEYVRTNVNGSHNVAQASMEAGVRKVIALSTDKASSPVNLYGASKLCSDKLFVSANYASENHGTRFSVVRYGNVIGSRGSVIPFFKRLAAEGKPLPITDKRMTRFWITIDQAVEFIVNSFRMMRGGELFVPRIPSMRVVELAQAIAPGAPFHEVGIRPGEKLHEEMIAAADAHRTVRFGERYVVLPALPGADSEISVENRLPDGFSYRSDSNDRWINTADFQTLIGE
ncbi:MULTISPECIES: UDP-N-acetylglucosamine 4,6-dehydratase (inverting) [Streptomyces]|uniref:UDP-N-acetylglucosamine 4,6-dehydratase (inverting) n=1 Tax=Streptomyces TaxID=1883 RepID=UPI0036B36223